MKNLKRLGVQEITKTESLTIDGGLEWYEYVGALQYYGFSLTLRLVDGFVDGANRAAKKYN